MCCRKKDKIAPILYHMTNTLTISPLARFSIKISPFGLFCITVGAVCRSKNNTGANQNHDTDVRPVAGKRTAQGVDMIFACRQVMRQRTPEDAAFYLTNENGRYVLRGRRLHHDVWLDCCLPDYDEYEMSFEALPLGDGNTRATRRSEECGERVVANITYRRVLKNLRATYMECKKYSNDECPLRDGWDVHINGDTRWLETLTGLREDVRVCASKYCWTICGGDAKHCPAHTP